MEISKKVLHLLIMMTFLTTSSYSQTYASIGVRVNIIPRIEVIGERSIDFGTLTPGSKIDINADSTMSGSFIINSDKPGEVFLDFDLPKYLTDENGNQLPISFNENHAGVEQDKSNIVKRFNPNHSKRLDIFKNKRIFMGCDLEIPNDFVHFGEYYGEIRIIVEY